MSNPLPSTMTPQKEEDKPATVQRSSSHSHRRSSKKRASGLSSSAHMVRSRSLGGEEERMLQRKLNETVVKHQADVYWLKLELNTTRKSKESVEDQLAELYRDMEALYEPGDNNRERPVVLTTEYITEIHAQLDKYEHIFRLMTNQISLVRSSCDGVVQTLKDELSALMDEKCRVEVELRNKLTDLDKENGNLKQRLLTLPVAPSRQSFRRIQADSANGIPPLHPPSAHKDDNRKEPISKELEGLRKENTQLAKNLELERSHFRDSQAKWTSERDSLTTQVESLQRDLAAMRPSEEGAKLEDVRKQEKEDTLEMLDRVSLLWDRADESIQNLESVMIEFRQLNEQERKDDQDRFLSTLETASLVHAQVKLSLMLVELRLRNNLAALKNDYTQQYAFDPNVSVLNDRIGEIQSQSMTAIQDIESVVETRMQELQVQSVQEAGVVKETLESKVKHLAIMQSRQIDLEKQISDLKSEIPTEGDAKQGATDELFVSRKVLEQLQNEVLQVVERIKEKNEEISRLRATVDEHKIREMSLMDELKRHIKEQGERQLQEQQRLMAKALQYETSSSEESDGSEDGEDDSCSSSLYEEETIIEEEVTVYEEG